MKRTARAWLWALAALGLVAASSAQGEPSPRVLADFEEGGPPEGRGAAVRVVRGPGPAPEGRSWAEARPTGADEASVALAVPPGVSPGSARALGAWLSSSPGPRPLVLRWQAETAEGRVVFQRRFVFDGGPVWHWIEWPLLLWRWGDDAVADWEDVRRFVLAIEGESWKALRLDGVALLPGSRGARSAWPSEAWLLAMAFGGTRCVSRTGHGFLVATDAAVDEDALAKVLEVLRPIPAWLRRVFGEAMQPLGPQRPVPLLVFEERRQYRTFFQRLGVSWRANIAAPRSGGYTVYDTATSYYDPKKGFERPVYFHEAFHAAAARHLRLLPGTRNHSWMQEALANYLQLCLYPSSLPRKVYIEKFGEPVDPRGRGLFQPLAKVLTGRITTHNYAQLASLAAFLIAERPAWMPALARDLARGRTAEEAFASLGADFASLQEAWFAWGARTFAPDTEGQKGVFPLPEEWRPAPAKDGGGEGGEEEEAR